MKLRHVVAAVLLVGLVAGARFLSQPALVAPPTPDTPTMHASAQCQECHAEVFAEWRASQHAIAFINPVVRREDMADGFRKKDCLPCHAPRPVFEHGLGKSARVLARDTNQVDGVDCLSCHQTSHGIAAATAGLTGACTPIVRAELRSTDLCAPCHNQHLTVDEWEASPAAVKGDDCRHCHMPPVERRRQDGTRYTGAFHGSRGGNDLELLKRAATVSAEIRDGADGRVLVAVVANTGAAHNIPTDARHRAIDFVVTLLDHDGQPLGVPADLGPGEAGGAARLRLRNPYRDEAGKVDTQLPAGAARALSVPVPSGAVRADISLYYKRSPYIADAEGTLVTRHVVDL